MISGFDYVSRGQSWHPPRAAVWNQLLRSASAHASAVADPGSARIPGFQIANETGLFLPANSIVALTQFALDPDIDSGSEIDRIRESPVMDAGIPDDPLGPIAITLESAEEQQIVAAAVTGVAVAKVDVLHEVHAFANAVVGDTTQLRSSECGQFRILDKQIGTGVKWAALRFLKPPTLSREAKLNQDILENGSGTATLCHGPVSAITCGSNELDNGVFEDGDNWVWSDGNNRVWSSGTTLPSDQITVWNFAGRKGYAGERVRVQPTSVQGGYPCFYTLTFKVRKVINGTADQDIEPGDNVLDEKTITVVYGDEALKSQQVVEYINHQAGGIITQGRNVTAEWWFDRGAYVIREADCEP